MPHLLLFLLFFGPIDKTNVEYTHPNGKPVLLDWQARYGGVLTRIAVSHVAPLGMQEAWRPLLPVTQLAATKPR